MTTQNTITVYQTRKAIRIVRGEHAPIRDFEKARVAKYRDTRAALKRETDAEVRAALARMDAPTETVTQEESDDAAIAIALRAMELMSRARDAFTVASACERAAIDLRVSNPRAVDVAIASVSGPALSAW